MTDFTTIASDAHTAEGFKKFAPAMDNGNWAESSRVGDFAVDGDRARIGVWRGEPAVYGHDGATGGEAFIVMSGSGSIDIDGAGEFPLYPGAIIVIPPRTTSRLTVVETLQKVAFASGTAAK